MMFPFFDSSMLILVPAIIFAAWAQFKVRSTFNKYAQIESATRISGHELARKLLDSANLKFIQIENTPGELTDHYDPTSKVLRLSESTFYSNSIAGFGVVAHEVGHAIQDAQEYFALKLRNNFVPVANFGSTAAFPLFLIGLFIHSGMLMDIGIIFFSAAVFFHIITLPVELDASAKAIGLLQSQNILSRTELPLAREVLNAAALTYMAAMAMAILQLIRLLMLRDRED